MWLGRTFGNAGVDMGVCVCGGGVGGVVIDWKVGMKLVLGMLKGLVRCRWAE